MLTNQQKKELRRLAQDEKTLVYIGKNGLTETVLESFEEALYFHNLVKVSLQKEAPVKIGDVVEVFEEQFGCDCVKKIGRTAIFYRYNPKGRIKI